MHSKLSTGIVITVETFYQQEYSNPKNYDFMFAYKITIQNSNLFPVKLLSRYWHILDSNGMVKEVEGEGVVGIQPVIQPAEKYQYVSGCNLKSELGRMQGHYVLQNMHLKTTFIAEIVPFYLTAPMKLN
ncbi:MAG: Co2+/Mg2+ efflux protein ApaG [Sphingobacteriales bacterium]|nr:Co2+/Mg2+ efflux protein ApaG [Sphingobacteriales bacterium]